MLGLIAVGCTTLFETIGFFAGKHWSLQDEETIALAQSLDTALDTLPSEYYGLVRQIIEKYFPWCALAIVASKIVIPRYEKTKRRTNTNSTNSTEQDNPFYSQTEFDTGASNGTSYRPSSSFRQ